jgi:hypothetical protein
MASFVEPFRPWIENILECALDETLTLEVHAPLGELAAEDLLAGAVLDRDCVRAGDGLRPHVSRWAVPPGVSPRIELTASRRRDALATSRRLAWDPHWKDTPVAVWLRDVPHPIVAVRIPYVSFDQGPRADVRSWLMVRRDEAGPALTFLRHALPQRKTIQMMGGHPMPLEDTGYDWDRLVLDDGLQVVRRDFETFLAREEWFRRHRLRFRRGYFLYGPPGNGKTSVVKVMAAHPLVEAYTLDFSDRELGNAALTELFEAAGHTAPALVILEDLDRLYAADASDNRTGITLQHVLGCLDGIASQDGVIVVATANEPRHLDPAILRRPGRFDRVIGCRAPSLALRRVYLERLCASVPEEAIGQAAARSDGFSFAQLREAYILAGQRAFRRGSDEVEGTDLLEGVALLTREVDDVTVRTEGRAVGFNGGGSELGPP